jgi:hypothetical protein
MATVLALLEKQSEIFMRWKQEHIKTRTFALEAADSSCLCSPERGGLCRLLASSRLKDVASILPRTACQEAE